jgi:hypothetical protein
MFNALKLITGSTLIIASLGAAPQALADFKSYPGASCRAAGSTQDLYYGSYSSGAIIANRTDATQTVLCPFVREAVSSPWINVSVRLRDRHDSEDIYCQAWAYDPEGESVWASIGVTTSGEGFETLFLGAAEESSTLGSYVLSCTLPPMQDANQPSYIASYTINE